MVLCIIICRNVSTTFSSYGECAIYKSATAVCNDVLQLEIDYVYARSTLADQSIISQILNDFIADFATQPNENCVKQVYRILCHFYLPTCGNATHPASPSSICQEDCYRVQTHCLKTWSDVASAINNTLPFPNCNDTSAILYPIQHCCGPRL